MKTILITGAASGFGKAAAIELAKKGHKVIATTHKQEDIAPLKAETAAMGLNIEVFKLDVTMEIDRAKAEAYDVDVLVNNAGLGIMGSLAEVPVDVVRKAFEVNVFGPMELTKLVLKNIMRKQRGTVIFISSVAGRLPGAFGNPYGMTKFALSAGAAALRKEIHQVAKNVHISIIELGPYDTGFNKKMFATKYQWMGEDSYFKSIIPDLKKQDEMVLKHIEKDDISGLVKCIVDAAEANKPKLRYVAPITTSAAIKVMRAFGV
ncbi:MAG: SDR family NAD(P)-dependent oxidoreductase [Sphingobacteriales bacterium JAD_PAG50586_3]|nr:MAG: SDR family NAD(P)-dependent oxidoreductase [Sphingobacteriales bacterium JAD_PAG50586_3]